MVCNTCRLGVRTLSDLAIVTKVPPSFPPPPFESSCVSSAKLAAAKAASDAQVRPADQKYSERRLNLSRYTSLCLVKWKNLAFLPHKKPREEKTAQGKKFKID